MSAHGKFSNQDPRVVSVFEIISSYFCDTFFNHVWGVSKAKLTGGESLTDLYVRSVQSYVIGVKNDERCYADVVQGVRTYFANKTRYTALSFADFVDRLVGVCVPPEYFSQFSTQDKDDLLSSVLCDLVSNMAAFVTRPDMLRRVIDEHTSTPDVTIRMIQDAGVTALITKRDTLFNKFLRKKSQARETVTVDVLEDMKQALRRLAREKAEAVADAARARAEAEAATRALRAAKEREAKMTKLMTLLRRGREEGPAAVGASLRTPKRDTIAELPEEDPAARLPSRVPRRERIAEVVEPPRRAPAVKAVGASFFDDAAGDGGLVTAASLRAAARPAAPSKPARGRAGVPAPAPKSAPSKPAPASAAAPTPKSAMASLLDSVVDAPYDEGGGSGGGDDLDDLLYGGGGDDGGDGGDDGDGVDDE